MNRKIFGNPLGQFFVILAAIAGLAGAGFYLFNVFALVGAEKFGALFEGEKAMTSIYALGAIAICVPFLLVTLISAIVGLATKRRGIGVFSVIFLLIGLLLQGICYLIGFGNLDTFFTKFDWANFFTQGDLLVTLAYLTLLDGFVFALIAVILAAARKRVGAIVLAIIALIQYVAAAYFFIWPLFAANNASGEVFVLFDALVAGGIAAVDFVGVIFLIVRGAFLALVGIAIFVLCLARVQARAKKRVTDTESVHVEHRSDDKKDEGPKAEVYERKDRIIIEIR